MPTDRYTKVILTIIAALLAVRCGQGIESADAEGVVDVRIVDVKSFIRVPLPVAIAD